MESEREVLSIIGRQERLFARDLERCEAELGDKIRGGSFLVLGGAGSIGQEVVKAIFRRQPRRLHVVDVSENNLVELVRDLRSSFGYIEGELEALPLDCGGVELDAFLEQAAPYDYVLNLMALKHVRSEKDAFTLMRMVRTNVLLTEETLASAVAKGVRRYFAVSSDKAVNPANAMGATKRVMELCLCRASDRIDVSSARFANVAFSDGSLLHGFHLRLAKRQPLSVPEDVRRYFITGAEAGALCLLASLLGRNREAFFPEPPRDFSAVSLRSVAERYLASRGYRAYACSSEDEARSRVEELVSKGLWPCYFFTSDTTGEKSVEEFRMAGEALDAGRYEEVGVIQWQPLGDKAPLDAFLRAIRRLLSARHWTREEILEQLRALLPEFHHLEAGKFLDAKM